MDGTPEKRLSPLLKLAIVSGATESLRLQILRGANINATDDGGRSPLMIAAARGQFGMCSMLLAAGARRDTRDRTGLDALGHATSAGHANIVDLLAPPRPQPEEAPNRAMVGDPNSEMPDYDEFGSWESEEETTEPEHQVIAVESAGRVQHSIGAHEPIDDYLDWDDVDVELPGAPRRRRGDLGEFELADIRRLVEQGLDEGRIILGPVLDRIYGEDEDSAREMRSRLEIICGDLGIVIEDDASYVGLHPYEPVGHIDERAVDDAMIFLESLGSRYADPLFQFYREMGRHPLLSREEEQQIGREMELAEEATFLAFAGHPLAVAALLKVAGSVEAGDKSLGSVTDMDPSTPAAMEESDSEDSSSLSSEPDGDDQDSETEEPADSLPLFLARIQELRTLHAISPRNDETTKQVASVMEAMRLRWPVVAQLGKKVSTRHPNLPASIALEAAMSAARTAQERLFRANLRLVYSTARKYSFRSLPLADIVQEGCIGLMKAVEKFQFRLGFKFSTYAMWWVKQGITRALADQERLVRLPVHMVERVNVLNRHIRDYERKAGKAPTSAELAELLSIDEPKVEKLKRVQRTVVSLDDPAEGPAIEGLLVDRSPTLDDVIELESLRKVVQRLLHSLDDRTARVLSLRFGLTDDNDMTLEEVGREFGVTRERIRQIEGQGLKRLRHPSRSNFLKGYVPNRELLARTRADESEANDFSDDDSPKTKDPQASTSSRRSSRPKQRTDATAPAGYPEDWAERAIKLAKLNQLMLHDFRPAGEGIFIEFDPRRIQVSQQVRLELTWLGFTYSAADRGFWRD